MANTIVHAGQGILSGALATLYTCPTNRKFVIKAATFSNHSGGALTLIVEVTATSGGTQRRYIESTVGDNDSSLALELINQVLEAGGVIQASGNGITYLLSGVEVNA